MEAIAQPGEFAVGVGSMYYFFTARMSVYLASETLSTAPSTHVQRNIFIIFRIHDVDNSSSVDGLELYKATMHHVWDMYKNDKELTEQERRKRFEKEEELVLGTYPLVENLSKRYT